MTCTSDRSGMASSGVRDTRHKSPRDQNRGGEQHQQAIADRPADDGGDHRRRSVAAIAFLHAVVRAAQARFRIDQELPGRHDEVALIETGHDDGFAVALRADDDLHRRDRRRAPPRTITTSRCPVRITASLGTSSTPPCDSRGQRHVDEHAGVQRVGRDCRARSARAACACSCRAPDTDSRSILRTSVPGSPARTSTALPIAIDADCDSGRLTSTQSGRAQRARTGADPASPRRLRASTSRHDVAVHRRRERRRAASRVDRVRGGRCRRVESQRAKFVARGIEQHRWPDSSASRNSCCAASSAGL